jgi:hypothetical protein
MIHQDKQSWNTGRADAMRGWPSKRPKGVNPLAYASGYIEGKAQRIKPPFACDLEAEEAAPNEPRYNLNRWTISTLAWLGDRHRGSPPHQTLNQI